jgi:hypothetical protein
VRAGTDAALTYSRRTSRATQPSKMATCCSAHTQCGFQSLDTSSMCGTVLNANTSSPCEHIGGNRPTSTEPQSITTSPSPSVVNHCNPDLHFRDLSFDKPLQPVNLCVTSDARREAQSLISRGRGEDPLGWSPCYAARCKADSDARSEQNGRRRHTPETTRHDDNSQSTQMNGTEPRPPRIQDPSHPDTRDPQVAQRTRGWASRAKHTEAKW